MADSEVEALKAALAVLDEADVPEDLREVAFNRLLDQYLGAPRPQGGGGDTRIPVPPISTNQGSAIGKIATKLDIDQAVIEQVFDEDEDGVHLNISRFRLDNQKKTAAQEVARLVAAGRQASEQEEWTSLAVIGEVADSLDVKDSNFSKHMTAMKGDGLRIRGTGGQREAKVNAVGFEAASSIVRRVTES